jgi:hypothetical protein
VSVLFHQGELSVIASGIAAGDRIVVTDPVPAVAGMLLKVQIDDELQSALLAAARGER